MPLESFKFILFIATIVSLLAFVNFTIFVKPNGDRVLNIVRSFLGLISAMLFSIMVTVYVAVPTCEKAKAYEIWARYESSVNAMQRQLSSNEHVTSEQSKDFMLNVNLLSIKRMIDLDQCNCPIDENPLEEQRREKRNK